MRWISKMQVNQVTVDYAYSLLIDELSDSGLQDHICDILVWSALGYQTKYVTHLFLTHYDVEYHNWNYVSCTKSAHKDKIKHLTRVLDRAKFPEDQLLTIKRTKR